MSLGKVWTREPGIILLASAAPLREYTAPAATFVASTTADNGGNLQLNSAGVHGLTAASVGRYIAITAGTAWTTGLYSILTVDDVDSITLDLAYSAALGSPTIALAGTGFTIAEHLLPANILGPTGSLECNGFATSTSGTNNKDLSMRLGGRIGNSTLGLPASVMRMNTTALATLRFHALMANTSAAVQIAPPTAATIAYQEGSGSSSAPVAGTVDTTVQMYVTLAASIATADEFIKLWHYKIMAYTS